MDKIVRSQGKHQDKKDAYWKKGTECTEILLVVVWGVSLMKNLFHYLNFPCFMQYDYIF